MGDLPHNLYRAAQVRELDRITIEEFQIPGAELMARAGRAAFTALRARWPEARRVAVLCGTGNNGGDGFVVARLAHEAGMTVEVYQVGDGSRLRGDALAAARVLRGAGVTPVPFGEQSLDQYDVVVDALLGTGLDRPVQDAWRAAIEAINRVPGRVVAIDIPSGLHADSGRVLGAAVRAALTVTFIGMKQGLLTAEGPDCCGELLFDDLGAPARAYALVPPAALRISYEGLCRLLAPRPRAAHKGRHGHVLVVGGDHGMCGAARMAGEAAARVGAGLVSIATRATHAPVLSASRPELMAHGVETPAQLRALLRRATVVAIGPGLGQSHWAQALLGTVLDGRRPLVFDADALNLLACDPFSGPDWVLTPHPGEAGRLLQSNAPRVQVDRFAAVSALQERYGGVCVLKGVGTLVYDGAGPVSLCAGGNPGMASGGMGDVLTGVIAGLMAQGLSCADAARLGVCIHALAGDRAAAAGGERGLLAGDLLASLRPLVNPGAP